MANLGYVQVTRRCNQCCRFCSNPEREVDLDLDRGRAQVDELADAGYDGVIFTGGEPTLSEHLPALLAHAHGRGLPPRIVTNGQRLGTEDGLLEQLLDAGLAHVHLSLYSHRREVVAELTGVPESLDRAYTAMDRLGAHQDRVAVDVNTVINARNADHLDEHVAAVVERFGFVRHLVFNNLDPVMNRVAEHPDTIPALWQFELSLHRACRLLQRGGRTVRIERVPLCYMVEFAHCSTETRKIVLEEERTTHFLDDKGRVRQTGFWHDKAACCAVCTLDPVCAGLDGVGHGFHFAELTPVFVPAAVVAGRVLGVPPREVPRDLLERVAERARSAPPSRQRQES